MKISVRLPAIVLGAALLAASAIGTVAYFAAAKELRSTATGELEALRESRHAELSRYFRSIDEDVELFAASPQVIDALFEFSEAFGGFDLSDRHGFEETLRRIYTTKSTAGDRDEMRKIGSDAIANYFSLHRDYHTWFDLALKLRGYYDLFLITTRGDIVYTVFKEADFGSNLLTGPWQNTGLAKVFHKALDHTREEPRVFVDFQKYEPSGGAPAAFIARRIVRGGRTIGILALQMPIDRINEVMQVNAGMGKTGETYLVGPDLLMRSDSRFLEESTILTQQVLTPTVDDALAGKTGAREVGDYRGTPVLSAYQPFVFHDARWAVMAEKDISEILAPVHELRRTLIFIGALVIFGVVILGYMVSSSITRPIALLSDAFVQFGRTREAPEFQVGDRRDEIGDMARAFTDLTGEIKTHIAELKEAEQVVAENEAKMRLAFDNLVDGLFMYDGDFKLLLINERYQTIFDLPDELVAIGSSIRDLIHHFAEIGAYGPGDPDGLAEQRLDVLANDEFATGEVHLPGGKVIELRKAPRAGGGGVVISTDITERRLAELEIVEQTQHLRMLHGVSEAVNAAMTFDDALLAAVGEMCRHTEWPVGHAYVPRLHDPNQLKSSGIWHLSDPEQFAEFRQISEETTFEPGQGLPGRVLESGEPAWIENLARDANFHRAEVAAQSGAQSACAFPVTADGELVAVVEFFTAELIGPNQRLLDTMTNIGRQLGGTLKRKAAEADVAQKTAILETTLETMDQGISMVDGNLDVLARNDMFLDLLELPRDKFPPGTNLADYFRFNAERGEYGEGDIDEQVAARLEVTRKFEPHQFERTRPDGTVIEIRGNPLPNEGGFVSTYTNITERKKAETKLAAKEAQLRMALDNMTDGMYVLDENLNFLFFNDQYLAMVDLPKEAVNVGGSVEAAIRVHALRGDYGEGNLEEIVQARLEKLGSSEFIQAELVITGGTRILDLRKAPLEGGGAVVVVTDVTERKRAEEAIAREKNINETVLESMEQGIYMVDEDLNFTAYNSRFREMQELPDGRFELGTPLEDFFRFNAERGIYGEGDVEEQVETIMNRVQGSERYTFVREGPGDISVEMKRSPVSTGGFVMTLSDITEQKRAEKRIADKEAQLRMALDNMPGAIFVVDENLDVVLANDQYAEMYGHEKGLMTPGRSMRDILEVELARGMLIGEGTPEEILEERLSSFQTGKTMTFEDRMPDGRFAQLSRKPAPHGHVVTVMTDITERKNAERIIADAMGLIHESIQYASRIQRSVLPDEALLDAVFDDHTVIWEPKDVVGGDIYLYRKCDAGHLMLLVDCTGHGVPGAFMTMIVTGAFDQALSEIPAGNPAALLYRTNQLVKGVLGQDTGEGESDDGFECGLCLIDESAKEVTFAGARFELWCVKGKDLEEIRGDKVGLGYRRTAMNFEFTNHVLPIEAGARFYMCSDGLIDQVGGDKRRAFGKRRLKGLILDYSRMKMKNQAVHILRAFEEYQHNEVRRDDISMVGFVPR